MSTAVLHGSGLTTESLEVARTDLTFHNQAGRVLIEATVCNRGEERTPAGQALLMAAPLGAFVPWRPLALLRLPPLEPGQTFALVSEAPTPAAAALGPPDRVTPNRLLTALNQGDGRWDRDAWTRQGNPTLAGSLPPDPFQLLGRSQTHWAGNLNVFVGCRAAERHLAQALRLYPGRTNLAIFVVGTSPDAYCFDLIGEGANWDAALYDVTDRSCLALDVRGGRSVTPGDWVTLTGQRLFFLALQPPRDCRAGTVEVHVTQRSSGHTAVVEFSLDAQAAGPGCFVV
jgi:hypothetical protein